MSSPLSRRTFLAQTALAATTALAAPALFTQAAPSGQRNIRKAIMYATVGVKGSVLEKFQQCKAAGFEGVEAMSHMKQDEVLAARDATGLTIPSVCGSKHWDKPLSHPKESVREEGLQALLQTLKDAHAYGAKSVLLVPGVVNKEVSYAECYQRSQEQIRKALPLAQDLKVKIAIENVWNNFLLSPLEAARYLEEFNSPWVAWHFDIGNVITYGWPEQWIHILGKRIATLHIKEFSREKSREEGLGKGFNVEFL
ncbi:MAG TPA: sugar phosphate isomerase/epimerase family protein, partial [Verrucomicrobiae bacterium]|nr:sugar phosphate isomerase/epimerase family protein [Verrucomicrobiae bacterium]